MKNCIPIIFIIFSFALVACSANLNQQDYIHWVEDYANGLHSKKTSGTYLFDIQYKPASYVLFQQDRNISIDTELFKTMVAEYEAMQYYTLTIALNNSREDFLNYGITTVAEQQQKLYYFSYLFQNDIYLEENGKRLPCALFHFERSYDLKPSRTFVLGFDNVDKETVHSTFVIDSPWLQTGPVRVQIEKKNIPAIKL